MKKDTIEFDFQENPSKAVDHNGAKYHVRIHNNQTITKKDICKRLQKETTVTDVDFSAVITGIERIVVTELSQGNAVSIDGICRFEPILGTNGKCNGTERGSSIRLKTVRVRPAKSLIEDVEASLYPCSRMHAKRSPKITKEELIDWLTDYFKSHTMIRRSVLEEELDMTRSLASKHLRLLVDENILLHPGYRNDYCYYPEPNFFKK